jgi:hypothetical protein
MISDAELECRKIFEEIHPKAHFEPALDSPIMKFGLACFEAGREFGKRDGVNEVVAVNESIGRVIVIPEWFRKGKKTI